MRPLLGGSGGDASIMETTSGPLAGCSGWRRRHSWKRDVRAAGDWSARRAVRARSSHPLTAAELPAGVVRSAPRFAAPRSCDQRRSIPALPSMEAGWVGVSATSCTPSAACPLAKATRARAQRSAGEGLLGGSRSSHCAARKGCPWASAISAARRARGSVGALLAGNWANTRAAAPPSPAATQAAAASSSATVRASPERLTARASALRAAATAAAGDRVARAGAVAARGATAGRVAGTCGGAVRLQPLASRVASPIAGRVRRVRLLCASQSRRRRRIGACVRAGCVGRMASGFMSRL